MGPTEPNPMEMVHTCSRIQQFSRVAHGVLVLAATGRCLHGQLLQIAIIGRILDVVAPRNEPILSVAVECQVHLARDNQIQLPSSARSNDPRHNF